MLKGEETSFQKVVDLYILSFFAYLEVSVDDAFLLLLVTTS
jgi:hypothetical protein